MIKSSNHFLQQTNKTGNRIGLEFSYDIIKEHGGEIQVEAKEDEGSKL